MIILFAFLLVTNIKPSYATVTPDGVGFWALLLGDPSKLGFQYGVTPLCGITVAPMLYTDSPSTVQPGEDFPVGYVIVAQDPVSHTILLYAVGALFGPGIMYAVSDGLTGEWYGLKITLLSGDDMYVLTYVKFKDPVSIPQDPYEYNKIEGITRSAAIVYWLPYLNTTGLYGVFELLSYIDPYSSLNCYTATFKAEWWNETGVYPLYASVIVSQESGRATVTGIYQYAPVVNATGYRVTIALDDMRFTIVEGQLWRFTGELEVRVEVWLNTEPA